MEVRRRVVETVRTDDSLTTTTTQPERKNATNTLVEEGHKVSMHVAKLSIFAIIFIVLV